MNSTNTIYLSKKGMKEIRKEITQRERELREAIVALHELDKTDAHEERLARMEKLAQLEVLNSELADKKMLLANAKQLPRKRDMLRVAIGSVVELIDTNGRVVRYRLVDSLEANPSDGRISIKSPLGQNLLGKQIRDVVEWTASFGTRQLKLVAIA